MKPEHKPASTSVSGQAHLQPSIRRSPSLSKRCDVVLCWIFAELIPTARRQVTFHLGLGYLQAYLRTKGVTSVQYVPPWGHRVDQIVDELLAYNPQIVGFTCYDPNYHFVKITASALKQKRPELLVLCGGPAATSNDRFILQDSESIDACVRGDGEFALFEVFKTINDSRRKLQDVSGLTLRLEDRLVRTPDRDLSMTLGTHGGLDLYPSPYLEGVFGRDINAGIVASRGCPHRCTYCGSDLPIARCLRYHSIDRIVAEFELLQTSTGDLQIQDNVFAAPGERSKQLFARLKALGNRRSFSCQGRADRMDRELLILMQEAGLDSINFGLESSVPRVLRNVRKVCARIDTDYSPETRFVQQVAEKVRMAHDLGIRTTVSIMSGLPGQTEADLLETVGFVENLPVDSYFYNPLDVYSGTPLHLEAEKWAMEITPSSLGLPLRVRRPFDTSGHLFGNKAAARQVDLLLHGTLFGIASGRPEGRAPSVFFLSTSRSLDERFVERTRNLLELGSPIHLRCSRHEISGLRDALHRCARRGLATDKLLAFVEMESQPGSLCLRFLKDIESPTEAASIGMPGEKHVFTLLPFATFDRRLADSSSMKLHGNYILSVETTEDAAAFSGVAERLSSTTGFEPILGENSWGCVDNECRWLNGGCCLDKQRRYFVDEQGNLSLCHRSAKVGRLGDSAQKIENHLARRREAEMLRRRCASCLVADSCSKCIFPEPFQSGDYCRIRRECSALTPWLNRLYFERSIRVL